MNAEDSLTSSPLASNTATITMNHDPDSRPTKGVPNRRPDGRFPKGVSGNPGGRPKGTRVFAIRELVAEALMGGDDAKGVWAEAIKAYRENLKAKKLVLPALEFAARVNKEIGSGAETGTALTINVVTGVEANALKLAAPRALPSTSPGTDAIDVRVDE